METPDVATFNEERKPQHLGGSWNYSAVFSNAVFALKSYCEAQFRLLASVDIEVAGQIMTPAISIYPPKRVDMAHDQLVMRQLSLTTIEIDSLLRPSGQLIMQVERQLRAGI